MTDEQTVIATTRKLLDADLSTWSDTALYRLDSLLINYTHCDDAVHTLAWRVSREIQARAQRRSEAEQYAMLPKLQQRLTRSRGTEGYIYLIQAETGPIKIGNARELVRRASQIITKLPFRADVIHNIATDNMRWAERFLHDRFAEKRLEGEWFRLNSHDITWLLSLSRLDEGSRL